MEALFNRFEVLSLSPARLGTALTSSHARHIWFGLIVSFGSLGCTVGIGEGSVTGLVNAPDCGLEEWALDLRPNFFVADVGTEEILEIRIQRGSGFEDRTNGVSISILDREEVFEQFLMQPIPITSEFMAPVRMALYLNRRCPYRSDRLPVIYEAVSGEITFDAIYAPGEGSGDRIEGSFTNVRLTDLREPEERFAVIDGDFSFVYARGRPAQRFP
ncbi:MAG: hypothetical protein AAF355_09485 [Myxococcota bacterium]